MVECDLRTGKAYGSAFCIHPSGLFVTNEHVVSGSAAIRLVLDPAMKTQKVVKAHVLRLDHENDLAVLRADGVKDFPALALGDSDGLVELVEVVACGFPFGKSLTFAKDDYPAVSINKGAVTALRRKSGALHRIQVDVALNPGNSGGALLDLQGKVVGVVVSGVRGTAVNFIIPISDLKRVLDRSELSFTAPKVARADLNKPATFEAKVVTLLPGPEPTLELFLTSGSRTRRVALERDGEVYRATAIPLPPSDGPATLLATFKYSDGTVTGNLIDRVVMIEGKERKLSQIKTIRGGEKPLIEYHDGTTSATIPAELKNIELSLGGDAIKFKTATLLSASLASLDNGSSVKCVVVAKSGDKVIAEASDFISFLSSKQKEEDKDKDKDKDKEIVALTPKAPNTWLLKEAKTGGKFLVDRDFTFTELPKAMEGGTVVVRDPESHQTWLTPGTLTAAREGTVYVTFLWKWKGKEKVNEVTLNLLSKEGWSEVKEEVETTFPEGEDWRLKTFKKSLKKGDVNLQLRIDYLAQKHTDFFHFQMRGGGRDASSDEARTRCGASCTAYLDGMALIFFCPSREGGARRLELKCLGLEVS